MDIKELYSIKGELTTDLQLMQAQLQQIDAEIMRRRKVNPDPITDPTTKEAEEK